MLTAQLRQMEGSGLLIRTVYPEAPLRVEYALADLGGGLSVPPGSARPAGASGAAALLALDREDILGDFLLVVLRQL